MEKEKFNKTLGGLTRLLKEKRKLMKEMTEEEAEIVLLHTYK